MGYKHNFSFASDWNNPILLATFAEKRKRDKYDVDIIEPFPDSFDAQKQIEILEEVVKVCQKKIRRISNSAEWYMTASDEEIAERERLAKMKPRLGKKK